MAHWTSKLLALPLIVFCLSNCYCQDQTKEEDDIRQTTQSFADAFNKHDSKKLTDMLSEDAVYVNPETEYTIEGRDAIEQNYDDIFSNSSDIHLNLHINSIRFPSTGDATARGTATVSNPGEQESQSTFILDFRRIDGQWKITRISEEDIVEPPSQYNNLKALEWLIGNWVDENEDSTVKLHYQWSENKNFIVLDYSVVVHDRKEIEGRQYIGWDPYKKTIRSWLFDSYGGFGEGTWHQKGNSWVADNAFTNPDGTRSSATNIYTMQTKDSFSWESSNREVDGVFMPDIPPIKIIRVKE